MKMLKLDHNKLEVWKKSIILVKRIYSITEQYPDNEKFGLVSQLRRAAISYLQVFQKGLLGLHLKREVVFMKLPDRPW